MGFDLRTGLHRYADDPRSVPSVDADAVASGVRRRRTVRGATVGLAGAAAVGLVAATAYALVGGTGPAPATSTTTSPTPTATSAPTTSAAPTTPPASVEPELVAVTGAGDLVLLDPVTGAVRRVVATGLVPPIEGWGVDAGIDVAPDRSAAFVALPGDGATGADGPIVRVSLDDGATEQVATGYDPAVSPDGRTLAYLGAPPGAAPGELRGITLLDLATGAVRHVPDEECAWCERVLRDPSWTADGTTVVVTAGWSDAPYGMQATAVTVTPGAETTSIQDGTTLGPPGAAPGEGASWALTEPLADGRLVVAGTEGPLPEGTDLEALEAGEDARGFLRVVGGVTGAADVSVPVSATGFRTLVASADGTSILVVAVGGADSWSLLRWDGADGVRTLAQDVRAVAW